MVEKESKTFILNRGEAEILPSKGRDYSGIMYSVRFTVNKPIKILALGFYGLTEDSKGDQAFITLKINSSDISTFPGDHVITRKIFMTQTVFAFDLTKFRRGKIFNVKLPKATLIPSNQYVEIKFQIDPQASEQRLKFHRLPENLCTYRSIDVADSGFTFKFLSSSGQLSTIIFMAGNDLEENSQEPIYEAIPDKYYTMNQCCTIS